MAASNPDDGSEPVSSPPTTSSPDELLKDLPVKVTEEDQSSLVGGRKAGKGQQEYFPITP